MSGFGAALPCQLTIVESTMNSSLYQRVLEENVRLSVQKLKLKQKWTMTMTQNIPVNPPRNGSKKRKKEMESSGMAKSWQSLDCNPIEMLWGDLKRPVHARNPSNII